jgi:hypothetical protein
VKLPGKPLQKAAVSEGNLVPGATLALTFNVTGSKQEIGALLSGQNRAFGLVIELVPALAFGTSRLFSVEGDDFLTVLRTLGYLPATSQTDRGNAAIDWLRSQMSPWGAGEEVAARAWLANLIGPAEVTLDETGAARFGWDLTRKSIQDALKGKRPMVRSLIARSEKPRLAPIFSFGDLCSAYPGSIVNLDTGASGCNELN